MDKPLPDKGGFYVYILECADGSLYTGYTNDLEKRLAVHNSGKGAKCLRGRKPVKLVWSKEYRSKNEALKEEVRIKALTRIKKQELIRKGGNSYA